ncbi:MAG TPA: acyl-CoA carboxylase subunit beta, partial [Nocardioides sp.]
KKGEVFDADGFKGVKEMVEGMVEEQSLPMFLSGLGYDDGVIDPRDTRTVLGLCLSAIATKEIEGAMNFGVFRM